jgi:hypothetical protein
MRPAPDALERKLGHARLAMRRPISIALHLSMLIILMWLYLGSVQRLYLN